MIKANTCLGTNTWGATFAKTTKRKSIAAYVATLVFAAFTTLILFEPAKAMNIKEVKSPGGIKAWLVSEDTVPLIALRFAFLGGSTQDPAGKEGRANFLTAMLDEGAGEMDSQTFQEAMEDIAMRLRFEESRDNFYGSFQTLTENRDKAADLLKLALTKPRFDKDAIERIRRQIKANLAYALKDPRRVASRAWFETAFPNHPYGRPSDGTMESIDAITAKDLEDYRASVFTKSNLKVVIVGDINEQEAGKLLDHVFGDLSDKSNLVEVPKTAPVSGSLQKVIDMPVPQSVAVFGTKGLARKDPDFLPAFVLNHIIGGGGFSSKLMEEVREKRGLAYSVYSYLSPFDSAAIFMGSVATKNESIAKSLDVIRGVLKQMAEVGPTEEDLENAKNYLMGSYALRFDTNSKIASQLLGILVEDMGIDYVDKRNQLVKALTVQDLKRAAARFLKIDDLIVTVVGQPVGLKGFKPHTSLDKAPTNLDKVQGKRG